MPLFRAAPNWFSSSEIPFIVDHLNFISWLHLTILQWISKKAISVFLDRPWSNKVHTKVQGALVLFNSPYLSQGSVKAPNPHGDSIRDSANMYAILLANELMSIELRWQDQRDTLELILGVWVEMSLYAADHCSQESHARQLSNGCEFITIVSLLAHHFKYYSGAFRDAAT